jgi:hypothetical protein
LGLRTRLGVGGFSATKVAGVRPWQAHSQVESLQRIWLPAHLGREIIGVSVAHVIADIRTMSATFSVHDTLSASTVYSAQLDRAYSLVKVTFRHATGTAGQEIYFTTDGSTPVVKGLNVHVCPCIMGASVVVTAPTSIIDANTALILPTTVKLISTLAADFSVEGVV